MQNEIFDYKNRATVGEECAFSGYWITSHRFYHLPSCRPYGHDRKPEFNSEIQNVHTLFRKRFFLEDKEIKKARLFITGDDIYKLYVNATSVGEGPAQSYPFAYNYNSYDVTDLLHPGENLIAVHLYYQGLFNIYLLSADNLCGMIAELDVEYCDGETETVATDRSWLYTECDAYTARYTYGYQTQFSEDIDMRRYPKGWTGEGFDESGWNRSIVTANPYPTEYTLLPQLTPPAEFGKVYPESITEIDGGYLFDFGAECVGYLDATLVGRKGDTVELRFAEELTDEKRARYEIRANCTYSDIITLSGDTDTLPYFDYKGFRYAEILGAPEGFDPSTVYVRTRNYPFPEKTASFSSSNEVMNRIWDICARGVRIGTQDTYYDCPTREKGGFMGDALITGLSHLILTADTRIYKKFILDCKNTSRYCPAIMAHVPTYDINICADYSALVPLFLEEYYNYTADTDFLRETIPVAEGVWEYYSQFLNGDLLLENIQHMDKVPKEMSAILIDWPKNLRDGYDMEKAERGICTTVNMFFYGFMKTMSRLYRVLGEEKKAERAEAIYTKMGESLIEKCYDREKGLFRDAADSGHVSLHANALELFFGLTPPLGYAPIVELIKERRLNCGVYFAYFVIKGLFNIGEDALATDLLLGKDEHSWYNMLSDGATTCMEAWGVDQKWNTSLCHPWSSSPIYFYTSEFMGIKPCCVGYSSFVIDPKIPEGTERMEVELPTARGMIKASFEVCGDIKKYTVTAPREIEIKFPKKDIEFTRVYR